MEFTPDAQDKYLAEARRALKNLAEYGRGDVRLKARDLYHEVLALEQQVQAAKRARAQSDPA